MFVPGFCPETSPGSFRGKIRVVCYPQEVSITAENDNISLYVKQIAKIIDDKSGTDIRLYDVRELSNVTDYFIITSAYNRRHIRALCDEISAFGKENGIGAVGSEGVDQGDWALIDFSVFVVHVFRPEAREFYDLELIWGDAPVIDWKEDGTD